MARRTKRPKRRTKVKGASLNARFPRESKGASSDPAARLLRALGAGDRMELAEAVVHADEQREGLLAALQRDSDLSLTDKSRVLTTLMALRPAPDYLRGIAELCSASARGDDPEGYVALLYSILRSIFTLLRAQHGADATVFYAEHLWPAYCDFLDGSLALPVVRRPRASSGSPRLAIIVPQLLAPGHAPTGQALEFALASMKAGYEVLLCDAELMPTRPHPAVLNGFVGNRRPRVGDDRVYVYDGVDIPHYRAPDMPFGRAKVAATLDRVLAFDPDYVLSQNVFNFVADKLASVFPTVFVPTGHTMAASRAHVYIAAAEDHRPPLVSGQRGTYVWPRYLALHTPVPESRTKKSDLEFADDTFVYAVVGNRLENDLRNEEFLRVIDRLCVRCPRVRVLEIGGEGEGYLAKALPHHAGRIVALPAVSNLRTLYSACDGYLNPFRSGGGVSAHIATLDEVPVVTLREYRADFTLDVASYVDQDAWSKDPEEYLEHAVALVEDAEFRANRTELLRSQRVSQPLLRDDYSSLQEILDLAKERFDTGVM